MNEIIYNLPENIDTTIFYGINNANIILLKKLFPTVKLVARGHTIKLVGITEEIVLLEKRLSNLQHSALPLTLTESNITDIVKGHQPTIISLNDTILHGVGGKAIMARSENQKKLVKEFEKNDLLFAIGPAGSGKTYTAIALAVKALKNKEVKKIILSRPAVEAGEKLGFLPGDMKEKIDPYLQPLYDALQDMIPAAKLTDYIAHGIIQIAPLAFMRGRTLSNAVIILDEAQNTSKQQIKMFLTRMGLGSKMIITGDLTQIDLPISQKSGLKDALEILKNVKGISRVEFNQKDIVRHKLVQRIVDAYEQNEKHP